MNVHRSDDRMWGNPVVEDTRIPLFRLVELSKAGYTPEQIANEIYPGLTQDEVETALEHADDTE